MLVRFWKLTALLVAALLITANWPGALYAAPPGGVTLEQAVQTVRENFIIPAAYTDFSSSFNSSESGQVWYLVWNDPLQKQGNFSAQVDAASGEVISMNRWKPDTKPEGQIPAISRDQAERIAERLLEKLIPKRLTSLVRMEALEPVPLTANGPIIYIVNWQRFAHQIPVEGLGAWVTVNAANGQIEAYSLNWSPLPLPAPAGIIEIDQARQAFMNSHMVKLEYVQPTRLIPRAERPSPADILLVYRLDHPSNGVIDALSGLPLLPEYGSWLTGGGADGKGGAEQSGIPNPQPSLTPEEQAEVIKMAGLISSEQAADIICKWAAPGEGLVLRTASLDQDWQNPDLRIWSLSWSAGSSLDTRQSRYLYGRVDAKSGEPLGFSLGLPAGPPASGDTNRSSARRTAEDLLRKLQSDRFAQFRLIEDSPDDIRSAKTMPPITEQPAWNFRFMRTTGDIDYPDNGADLAVDRATGKITSYNLTWNNGQLPAAQGIISTDQADQLYLQAAPLKLFYAPFYSAAQGTMVMRLVYHPQIPPGQPAFRMIDAHNGQLLDDSGLQTIPVARAWSFNDISGHFAAREIALLGQAGLMTEYGDAFHPGEPAKLGSLLRAMLGAAGGLDAIRNLTDEEVVRQAVDKGWLEAALPPDQQVNRGFLAQLMVRNLGIDYLAGLPDIYRLHYQDASALDSDLSGYAALCWGLGIIRADGVNFQADQAVTRAEAAAALVRCLGIPQ